MTLTPLMQVLLALRYYSSGAYFSVVGGILAVSKVAIVKTRYYASGEYFSVVGGTLGVSKVAIVKTAFPFTRTSPPNSCEGVFVIPG